MKRLFIYWLPVSALALLVLITAVLWVRSYWVTDIAGWRLSRDIDIAVTSNRGALVVSLYVGTTNRQLTITVGDISLNAASPRVDPQVRYWGNAVAVAEFLPAFHNEGGWFTVRHNPQLTTNDMRYGHPNLRIQGKSATLSFDGLYLKAPHAACFLLLAFLLVVWASKRKVQQAWRRRKGRCTQCAYDLRGLEGPGCPECGAPISKHDPG